MLMNVKIRGFERYKIDSSTGKVFNIKGEEVKGGITPTGYRRVELYSLVTKKYKRFYTHKLIFATVNDLDYDLIKCRILDGDKLNCRINNMELL